MNHPGTKWVIIAIPLVVLFALLILFLPRQDSDNQASRVTVSNATSPSPKVPLEPEVIEQPIEQAETPTEKAEPVVTASVDATPEEEPEPIHWYNGMNPEDQPRAFHRESFAGRTSYPPGFKITGDDVRLGEQGWTLAPGEDGIPRSGMIESPPMKLEFPSNALNSLWNEVSPEGTEVLFELAASPDGEHWTSWHPTTGAHTAGPIAEFNEATGERNPNYGFTRGDMVFFGVDLYQYYRYSIMLYSETAESPSVSDFVLYQQDSTMGDGALVEYDPASDITFSEDS